MTASDQPQKRPSSRSAGAKPSRSAAGQLSGTSGASEPSGASRSSRSSRGPRGKNPRPCSIADTLAVVGEKYSLLVLREVFLGVHRFDAIARNIGAPRDILTTRLRGLVDAGVLERTLYSERPARYEYRATRAGQELRPVLLMLMDWGDRHLAEVPPTVWRHKCGADLDPALMCRCCGEEVHRSDTTVRFQVPGWSAQGPE